MLYKEVKTKIADDIKAIMSHDKDDKSGEAGDLNQVQVEPSLDKIYRTIMIPPH